MSELTGPLSGLRVIDLTGAAGAFATRQVAELGADVIRVEPPGGDATRRRQPFVRGDAPKTERSLYHQHFNQGKRSIVLDLEQETGREMLRRLAATADAFVETAAPGEMDRLGVGYEALRAVNPRLLYATLTPFGQEGPFRDAPGVDLTTAAASGLMYLNGFPDDPPNVPGAEQAYHMGALVTASALLIALVGRALDVEGRGHRIDVSLQEATSMATLQTANANIYAWHGRVPRRQGLAGASGQRSLYPCRDGRWLSFVIPLGAPALWQAFVEWMHEEGLGEPYEDPRWGDPPFRAAHTEVTAGVLEALCAKHDRAHLFHEGQRRRMLVMPVNHARDLLADGHLQERGFFNRIEHEELGRTLVDAGPPYRFSATPARLARRAPLLGEHTDEVLNALDEPAAASPPAAAALTGSEAVPWRPLEGIRVVDFFWLIAGPSTSRVLADHGADVIKIESESRLDNIRTIGVQPSDPGSIDTNGVFNDCNTNKRSITLNLNHPEGIELAKELVRHSDIVTNNFTGDRMDRWGLGYDELRQVKPDIIMLTMPVMGTTGPYKRYGAYGNGVIAFGGLAQNMGFPHRPPTGIAPLYSDFAAPYVAVSALMAALYHRERTGEGQFIELAQAEATINLLGTDLLEYTLNGDLPPRLGNRSRDYAPHGAFRCAGEDRWCAVAVRSTEDWRRLAEAIGRSDLADDPELATLEGRQAREEELDQAITAWTSQHDAWEVATALQQADVPAAVVEDLEDLVARDPWLSKEHLVPVAREEDGVAFTTHAQPARIDGRTPPLRVSPRFGEHNEEVYRGLLGLTDSDYAELLADGVIH